MQKIESLKDRIRKIGTSAETIKSDDDNAIEKLRAKLDALTKKQDAMKAENAKARKRGQAGTVRSIHPFQQQPEHPLREEAHRAA